MFAFQSKHVLKVYLSNAFQSSTILYAGFMIINNIHKKFWLTELYFYISVSKNEKKKKKLDPDRENANSAGFINL